MGNRELKARIGKLLGEENFAGALTEIGRIPCRQAVNPLFSFFYSGEEVFRWRAITAMGEVVARMADTAMEQARVVMRRLMWNLNDESGGIGWGSPEAMGEITARHEGLAKEFTDIVISYINPEGNYLEHEMMQRGSLWGVGRLAHARPLLAGPAMDFLPAFFDAPDPFLRGTAIWAAGPILTDSVRPMVEAHLSDNAPLRVYRSMNIESTTVAQLSMEAIALFGG